MADSEQNWKEKYLRQLDRLEEKQKEWEELEEKLQRAVGRLAVAGYGQNRHLDGQLDQVREAIRKRKSSSDLETLVQTASETASRLQEQSSEGLQGTLTALRSSLGYLEVPKALQSDRKRLLKRIDKTSEREQLGEVSQEINRFLDKLKSHLQQRGDNEGEQRRGLLGALFGNDGKDSHNASQLVLQLADRVDSTDHESLKKKLTSVGHLPDDQQILDGILDILIAQQQDHPGPASNSHQPPQALLMHLVERIDFPQNLQPRVEQLKEQLHREDMGNEDIDSLLSHFAQLVSSARRQIIKEKLELESLLKGVTDRISVLDKCLKHAQGSQQEAAQDQTATQEQFRDRVSDIKQQVADADDLETLKEGVENSLNAVESHILAFLERENQRNQQANERIEELAGRLQEMNEETARLQKRIREEKALASRDALTGLFNRLAWEEKLQYEFKRWQRYQAPLTLLIVDVDHFKQVNDNYGHQAGDRVLKALATRMRQQLRTVDFIARFGGEEFVVLMPDTGLQDGIHAAEKLREDIAELSFQYEAQPVKITISCGLAEFQRNDSPQQVFERADRAVYLSKNSGRNQVRNETELTDSS